MKWHWIQQRHNSRLLLFFNGWGMDEHAVAHLECDDWDVLTVCDYRDLDRCDSPPGRGWGGLSAGNLFTSTPHPQPLPGGEFAVMLRDINYKEIAVICWSMGVWAYARVSAELQIQPVRVIAINGTPQPIHADFGIAPDAYQATLDHFDEAGREKFFKRMCGSAALFRRFNQQRPQRGLAEQAEELAAIQAASVVAKERIPLLGGELIALISAHDRIMPTANQQRYWEGRAQCVLLDAPHYPFFLWKRWADILTIF
ncbi:hypothetical protein U14_02346 [Candidatus Moduliflexus flocculans]|uniref:DUF452 family protein n=1 Tax=Candidatus Moduliflexus flocculans TaxID=1499966 RepID=A0A0S6VUD7_9BACT|nr:hypothetical protein U14_02346 [Candidatus Moduliflexus flocculans]